MPTSRKVPGSIAQTGVERRKATDLPRRHEDTKKEFFSSSSLRVFVVDLLTFTPV
jgi:hypothetical protein